MKYARHTGRAVLCLIAGIGFLLLASRCHAQNKATQSSPSTPVQIATEPDGVLVTTPFDKLRLTVCGPNLIHVVASPDGNAADATPRQPWMISPASACGGAKFTLHMPEKTAASSPGNPSVATLDTGTLQVRISLAFGNLEFFDAQGKLLLSEFVDAPRRYQPETVNGQQLYRVMDQFYPEVREGFYGLGQHQDGVFNDRGTILELGQVNTDVAIPLMVSTNGYGIFWNTAAVSYFDNRYASELRFRANAAHAIDYYFLYGPEMDSILHTYRNLTGHAPMFPEWAYGFFQSKDRYKTQQELLQIAQEYRQQHVPLDAIVQDWKWWVHQGDPTFLPDAYPDVPGTLRQLHDEHVHAMISVWGLLVPQSQNYKEMLQRGLMIPGTTDYDPTNPAAGDFYWNHLVSKLFAQGWDAFWLDSTEPEIAYPHGGESNTSLEDRKLFIGNGALYTNIFPLMHTGIVYRHWRASGSDKRVFLLTRSAFAGEQRNAATTWSGDVYSTFTSLQRQVPAGLNFMLSGMPYWTTDIGGYGPPYARDTRDPAYQELYVRWFEYGAFCPIFRTHGHRANDTNELFSYGPVAPILIRYDKLRYRLMPYIYSLAWKVTSDDGTIMRPLVMDWRTDPNVWNIGDQFMFGPALLVNPVTHRGMQSRWLYLPPAAAWYDFWTGKKLPGAQHIEAAAPLDRIPLYVKAGSILPMGPEIEYANQMPGAPIDLRIYRGANGTFTLYEDQGNSYAYEKGAHAIIPLQWKDATQTLTIGARTGTFPGMVQHREFHIILVGENHGTGEEIASNPDKTVAYDGAPIEVSLK
ncbi:MAG TPA: TIM-barrel domain-containing protein [Acidobacteriaceae bacterium]|nr:TIM-barrel domain-containing protein [Acidobacteriaceae bacterium]